MRKFIVSYITVFIGEMILALLFNPSVFPFLLLGFLLSLFNAAVAVTVMSM